ncbi:hypothetical protein KQI68_07035 [Peptoniphilus sp. MSJ-1]|uniref:Uncharacterized protein n=1 Tax=Peptoniphilus ovalis TaxID=2841503 RepID=A0ABS6FHD7_9FIRM|nr:hypothetical protein [Peptoniphilus ovalis]MBU5669592.1 hypothetical protein [Peptoniphilus ovalis]
MKKLGEGNTKKLRNYFKKVKMPRNELADKYKLSHKTAETLLDTNISKIIVFDGEYKTLRSYMERDIARERMLVPDDLQQKVKDLSGLYDIKKDFHRDIGIASTTMKSLEYGTAKTITFKNMDKINQFYLDHYMEILNNQNSKVKVKKGKKRKKIDYLTTKEIKRQEAIRARQQCRDRYQPLKIGKTYKITQFYTMGDRKISSLVGEGTVIKEFKNYYLMEHNGHKTTTLKNFLYCHNIEVEEIIIGTED